MNNTIKIFDNSNSIKDLSKRIEVTNGVEIAVGYDIYNMRKYKENALKPKNNWRLLGESEIQSFLTNDLYASTNKNLGLVKIPTFLSDKLKEIGFPLVTDFVQFSELFREKPKEFEELTILISEFFSEIIAENHSISEAKLLCISYENPKIETIAYDERTDEYFGLHFDSSVGNKLFERKNNPNRLSINIGNEPRYLIFLNIDMDQMFDMVCEKNKDFINKKNQLSEPALVSTFFELYPDFPVYRLKQYPYEAYIAPTDNIVHDGSTVGKNQPDMTMVFTGYFKLHTN